MEATGHFRDGTKYRERDLWELHLLRRMVQKAGLVKLTLFRFCRTVWLVTAKRWHEGRLRPEHGYRPTSSRRFARSSARTPRARPGSSTCAASATAWRSRTAPDVAAVRQWAAQHGAGAGASAAATPRPSRTGPGRTPSTGTRRATVRARRRELLTQLPADTRRADPHAVVRTALHLPAPPPDRVPTGRATVAIADSRHAHDHFAIDFILSLSMESP